MDENRTLERLEYFKRLVSNLGYANQQERMSLLEQIKREVGEAGEDKLISQQMLQDYDDLFQNNRLIIDSIVNELNTVADKHLLQFDDAYEQMTNSLEFDKDAAQNSEKDSKEVLEQIKDAMEKYADAYSEQNGALSAVVEFSNIGNIIKDALKEDKISKATALRLSEPLHHMKDFMFNNDQQRSAYDEFQSIIQKRLDKVAEKEEKNDGPARTGVLEKAGNVLDKTANAVVHDVKKAFVKDGKKSQKESEATDKVQEQQIRKDEAHGDGLEHKEKNADVSLRPENLMQREDEQEKMDPKTKEAMLRLKDAINEYRAVASKKPVSFVELNKVRDAYNNALKDPGLEDFTMEFYTTDAHMGDIDYNQTKLLELIDKELGNEPKQEKHRQKENENISPTIVHNNVVKEAKTESQTEENALENLRHLWERLHETRAKWSENPGLEGLQESNKLFSDFHQALRNPKLKDIADEYYKISRDTFENGLPNYEAVMDAINKGFGQEEQPQQMLGPDDMAHGADLSKKQENKDVSPRPENLMQREDMTNDKVNAGEKKPEDYEDLIYGLEEVLSHHKDRDPESFKRMMFALKDLSQQWLLPEDMKKEYRDVFDRVKELSGDQEQFNYGSTRLRDVVLNHLDTLDLKRQQGQNQKIPVPNAQYKPGLEKKEENTGAKTELGADDIRLNTTVREQAHSNSSIEQRSLDRSGKDAPYDFRMEKPQLSREQHIANYVQGKGKVEEMFADKEPQHKKIDPKILEAYKRKMLSGRVGGGNV